MEHVTIWLPRACQNLLPPTHTHTFQWTINIYFIILLTSTSSKWFETEPHAHFTHSHRNIKYTTKTNNTDQPSTCTAAIWQVATWCWHTERHRHLPSPPRVRFPRVTQEGTILSDYYSQNGIITSSIKVKLISANDILFSSSMSEGGNKFLQEGA